MNQSGRTVQIGLAKPISRSLRSFCGRPDDPDPERAPSLGAQAFRADEQRTQFDAERSDEVDDLGFNGLLVYAPCITLERLIANLLDNAIRHNIAEGHVEITTGVPGVSFRSESEQGTLFSLSEHRACRFVW
jgi:signal transduction histidine kinase